MVRQHVEIVSRHFESVREELGDVVREVGPNPDPNPNPDPDPNSNSVVTLALVLAIALVLALALALALALPYLEQVEAERAKVAEAAKAQVAEPPKRPPSSSLAAGYAPTGNEYRDRKARAAGGRGSAARRAQTPTAARHTTAARSRQTDR